MTCTLPQTTLSPLDCAACVMIGLFVAALLLAVVALVEWYLYWLDGSRERWQRRRLEKQLQLRTGDPDERVRED